MAYPYGGKHDIKINGVGEIIDFSSLRRTFRPESNPRIVTTGERSADDLDQDWSWANWRDLRGGDTQDRHEIDTKYLSSAGIDPRATAQGDLGFTLLRAVEQVGTIKQTGGRNQDRLSVTFGGYILFFGKTYANCFSYDGSNWVNHKARAGKGFIGAVPIGRYIYAVTKNGIIFKCSIDAKKNALTVSKVKTLDLSSYGSESHEVTAVTAFQSKIILGVGQDLLTCATSDYALTSVGSVDDGQINCFADMMGMFDTSIKTSILYFGVSKFKEKAGTRTKIYGGMTIYLTNRALTYIYEAQRLEAPFHIEAMAVGKDAIFYGGGWKEGSEIKGRIYMMGDSPILIKELEDDTNEYDSSVLDMRSGREVLVGFSHKTGLYLIMESGGGFPAWSTSITASTNNIVSGIEIYNGQTYFAVRGSGIYRVSTSNYVTSGTIILSHFTAKLDLINKLFAQIKLELKETLSSNQTIVCSVRYDDEQSWTSLGTMSDSDGTTKTFDFPEGWLHPGASIKFELTQLASETPPRIKAIILRYTQSLAGEETIVVRIRASDHRNRLRDGSWESRTAKAIVSRLRGLKEGGNIITYSDPEENDVEIIIKNVTDGIISYTKAKLPVRYCEIAMSEVKSE